MCDRDARLYAGAWTLACLIAIAVAVRSRASVRLFAQDYWRWLLVPWKLATFGVAFIGMVVIAPVSGDPTWDWVDGGAQSLLTFATAPWAFGVVVRTLLGRERRRMPELYVATCAWLFSVSWFYDAWLWHRDGAYPRTWSLNLGASSALYALAGALWNLEDSEGRWPTFGFLRDGWPRADATARTVAWVAAAIMAFTTLMMSPFLWMAWQALRAR